MYTIYGIHQVLPSDKTIIAMHTMQTVHSQIQRYCPSNKHLPKIKSTTYIAEITVQKNEKYLYEERNTLAYLPARLVSTKKFSAFEFTEKCFTVFGQSNCMIFLTWHQSLLFFWEFSSIITFMVWFKILVKSRGGVHFYVQHRLLTFSRSNFFQLKAKYPSFIFLTCKEQS